MWRKTWIALLIIKKEQRGLQPIVLTQHHPLSKKALLHNMKILDHPTLWCYTKKPAALPYKIQNSSLWISRMRDPYIDVCKEDESAHELISGFSLSVLASTWRLRASYSSLVELSEASVIGEDSGSFHCLSTSRNDTAICHFPLNTPW